MRIILGRELNTILDRHGKWLRNEEGGERANLSSADLSSANLSSANLSSADLSFADLSSADLRFADLRSANLSSVDLSYADLRFADLSFADLRSADLRSADLRSADLIIFQFRRHQAFFMLDGTMRIGCIIMPISEWLLGFEEIGKKEGYSELEILAYGNFIKSCAQLLEIGVSK
jgi:pentapeptide repeat protein